MPVKVNGIPIGSASEVLTKHKKKLGETIGAYGGLAVTGDRIPTGLLPLDLATGGGIPRGRCTIVYGPSDSGKTSVAYLIIANHQRLWPDLVCVYVAIEPFDGVWAAKLGVNVDKLIVVYPDYAEQAVDLIHDFLMANDIGLVVLDSIGAMITTQEAEKSAEGATPGTTGQVCGKLVKKTTLALREGEKAKRYPTLLYINQTRFKIGVMFGDPETQPGGQAPLFQAQLRVRFYGKAIKDSKVSDLYPVRREINFILKKNKLVTTADAGKVEMVTYPHNGLNIGESDDINTITEYLKKYDALEKDPKGKGWLIFNSTYPTLKAFQDRVYTDRAYGAEVRKAIIEAVLADKDSVIPPQAGGPGGTVTADGEILEG